MSVLKVNNIHKCFRKSKVLEDINFTINKGEIVGFIGPNGSGKTTTLRIITGLIFPSSGDISICGYNLSHEKEKALSNIAAIVENPGLYNFLSGRDNLNFIRKLRGISVDKMLEIIKLIGLSDRIDDSVKKYSLGMKQRLALGMCLLSSPKLLILDEPTNGLDPTGIIELRDLLSKLSRENKTSILMSSHALSEVEKICDKLIFIKEGRIISVRDNKTASNSQVYKVFIDDFENVEVLLKGCDYIYDYYLEDNNVFITINNSNLNDMLKMFIANNINYRNLELINSGIEREYKLIYGENK